MDSIFGRSKKLTKSRQSSVTDLADRSVPYDRLPALPSPRSPSRPSNFISAPITNPTLTPNGTELNKFAMARTKLERERAYDTFASTSSSSSLSTTDSATLYTDSLPSPSKLPSSRRSEASFASSSGMRSPNSMLDFGHFPPPTPNSVMNFPGSSSSATMRPSSGMTTRSSNSDGNRLSKYAPSFTSSEGSHLPHFHLHRQNGDDFNFPRPETDEEIEALFENVKRTRDLGDLPDLPIEQKWHMVYNDYHIRWKDDKARDEQARKQDSGQPAPIIHESPEWFIRKFLDKTITPKQAGSLQVSLRSKELRCAWPAIVRVTPLTPR